MTIKMKGKKAAVGETITWIIAFSIIFFVIFVFFFSSLFVAVDVRGFQIKEGDDRLEFSKNYFYHDTLINPEKIKFVKTLGND